MLRSKLLACALLLSQVVFILAISLGAACSEGCPDDGPDGRCPPACTSCLCSPRPVTTGRTLAVVAPAPRAEVVQPIVVLAPCEPAPADIFHVPKPLLA